MTKEKIKNRLMECVFDYSSSISLYHRYDEMINKAENTRSHQPTDKWYEETAAYRREHYCKCGNLLKEIQKIIDEVTK